MPGIFEQNPHHKMSVLARITNYLADVLPRRFGTSCLILLLVANVSAMFLVGLIPKIEGAGWAWKGVRSSDGLGWDGATYFSIADSLGRGELGKAADPYYFFRIGSFLHLVAAGSMTQEAGHLVAFMRLVSSASAVSGILLAVMAAYALCPSPRTSAVSYLLLAAAAIATFGVFTMPSLYPVASDHVAIFVSGLSLYAWACLTGGWRKMILLLLCVYAVFVMPGLFLVPGWLLMFPLGGELSPLGRCGEALDKLRDFVLAWMSKWRVWNFLQVAVPLAAAAVFVSISQRITDEQFSAVYVSGFQGLLELRAFSLVVLVMVVGLVLFSFVARLRDALPLLDLRSLVLLGVVVPLCFIAVSALPLDWDKGLRGSVYIKYLVIRGQDSPLSSLPALFAYFGPVGVLGLFATLFGARRFAGRPDAGRYFVVAALASFFGFFLLVNTETRQFAGAFPLLVFLACVGFGDKPPVALYSLVFALVTLAVGYPVDANIAKALASQITDYQNWQWQAYFGRFGPWMSLVSRVLWGQLLLIYIIGLLVCLHGSLARGGRSDAGNANRTT
jgi:hypothetical protein